VFDRTLLNVVYGKLKSILEVANALGTVDPLPADRHKIGGKSGGMVLQPKKNCLVLFSQSGFLRNPPSSSNFQKHFKPKSQVFGFVVKKWAYLSSRLTT
jgi:hypothetical protein